MRGLAQNALFFALMWMLWCGTAFAQEISVTAKVDRNEVRPGEVFYLTITIQSGESSVNTDGPRLPDISPLEIVNSTSGSEMRSVYANGKFQVQRSVTYRYGIAGLQPGAYSIGPAEVVVGGEVYKTQPIQIKIVEGAAPPPPSQNLADEDDPFRQMDEMFSQLLQRRLGRPGRRGGGGGGGGTQGTVDLNDAFYIQVEVDKTKVYVGEQLTVSWYLVTRAQIADIDTLKYPAVEGFWREDIELATRLNFKPEDVNGIIYNKALLASFALFPIKPGPAKIDEYTAKCTVYAFNAFGASGQQVLTKSSQVVPIEVLPLPTENRPADFSGAVGDFRVTAKLDKTTAPVGTPVTLKVRFDGRGNAKLIESPKIQFPPELQVYDPKSSTKFFPDGRSFMEYEYILVPRQTGEIKIPAFTFSYFNPQKRAYFTEATSEFTLTATPGDNSQIVASGPLAAPDVKQTVELKPTLPGLALQFEDDSAWTVAQRMTGWSLFGLLGLFFLGWRYYVEFGDNKKREGLRKRLRKKFAEVEKKVNAGDSRGAAVEMTNVIYYVLGELSGLGGASREMSVLLEKAPPSFRRDVAEPLQKLIRHLEVLGFAPEEVSKQMSGKKDLNSCFAELKNLLNRSLAYEFTDESKE